MCICCNCQQQALYIWFFVPIFSEIVRRISSGDTVRSGIVHRVYNVTICCVITSDAGHNTA